MFSMNQIVWALAFLVAVSNAFAPPKRSLTRVQQGVFPWERHSLTSPDEKVTKLSFELPDYVVSETEASMEEGAVESEVDLELVEESFLSDVAASETLEEIEVVSGDAGLSDALELMQKAPTNETVLEPSLAMEPTDTSLETVSAILAASEEAVAAAEASLSEDVQEKLSFMTDSTEPPVSVVPDIVPLSSVVGEPVTTTPKIVAPSVRKILTFAVPAIGVWLCGPLLSLIDTSTVGIFSGTVQQAALNPAVAVTDYAALLIAFLFTATTNMVATAQETDRSLPGQPRTTKALIGAMQLSTYVGTGLGAILFIFARPLLRAIIGNDGISPAVFAAALKYVRIRALGMPAAAVIGSAQAACLGMQDIRSPLYVLFVAAVVNFIGDMVFVGSSHHLIGGAAGAAWATVFSQFAAVSLFIGWLCNKPKQDGSPKVVNLSKAIMELTGQPSSKGKSRRRKFCDTLRSFRFPTDKSAVDAPKEESSARKEVVRGGGRLASMMRSLRTKSKKADSKPKEETVSVRGFLDGQFRGRDLVKFPSREITNEFAPYVVPVTSTQVGRVSGYVAMSHVVSSSLGTVSMAAQQVIVSLFYCLCPIADSLSLTAQSFVPSISEKAISNERSQAMRKTTKNFFKAGGVFGGAMVGAVACIPFLSRFFTTDPAVVALVNSVSPLLLGFFAVHGVLCSAEGLLLGQKDLSFLGRMYAAYFAVVPFFMLRVKRAALSGVPYVNLTSVWKVFLGYQLFRFAAWVGRVTLLQKRTEAEAVAGGTRI